jgi:hypothetical protein
VPKRSLVSSPFFLPPFPPASFFLPFPFWEIPSILSFPFFVQEGIRVKPGRRVFETSDAQRKLTLLDAAYVITLIKFFSM